MKIEMLTKIVAVVRNEIKGYFEEKIISRDFYSPPDIEYRESVTNFRIANRNPRNMGDAQKILWDDAKDYRNPVGEK